MRSSACFSGTPAGSACSATGGSPLKRSIGSNGGSAGSAACAARGWSGSISELKYGHIMCMNDRWSHPGARFLPLPLVCHAADRTNSFLARVAAT